MRLRIKLTLLLGLIFALTLVSLFISAKTGEFVGDVVRVQAEPQSQMLATTLAISVRGQQIVVLLQDLREAVSADDVPQMLAVSGRIAATQQEREVLLGRIPAEVYADVIVGPGLTRRKNIVLEESIMLRSLMGDLDRAGSKEARMGAVESFLKGKYAQLEVERRMLAEEVAVLASEQTGRNFEAIIGALERGRNLTVSIVLSLLISFGFILFFISRSIIVPVEQIAHTIEQISVGKLEAQVPLELKESKDELGRLARAFDRTILSLKMAMKAGMKRGGDRE